MCLELDSMIRKMNCRKPIESYKNSFGYDRMCCETEALEQNLGLVVSIILQMNWIGENVDEIIQHKGE